LLQSGILVLAPERCACARISGSTWCRQSLHQTIARMILAAATEPNVAGVKVEGRFIAVSWARSAQKRATRRLSRLQGSYSGRCGGAHSTRLARTALTDPKSAGRQQVRFGPPPVRCGSCAVAQVSRSDDRGTRGPEIRKGLRDTGMPASAEGDAIPRGS
jgi:hypothetical protein